MSLDTPPPQTDAAAALLPADLARLAPDELLVNELFHSVQGESTRAGLPCFFIRLTGCPLRCTYCDTEYAFFEGQRLTVAACVERAESSGCRLVEVTGGEPLVQRSTPALLRALCDRGFEVLLETSGAVDMSKVDPRVRKIVDVKCPSSGMERHNLRDLPAAVSSNDELKFVVGSRADFDWALAWLDRAAARLPEGIPIHASPIHGRLSSQELAGWVLASGRQLRVSLQLHKLIWPGEERGV